MLPAPPEGECHFTSHPEAVNQAGERPAKGDPVIKGIVNEAGEKVYFVPGMRRYPNVRVDLSSGGQWFCTEQAAAEAGFKASTAPRDPFPTFTATATPSFRQPTPTPR